MNLSRARLLTKRNLIIVCSAVFVIVIGICAVLVASANENVTLKYRAHVAYKGWLDWQTDGKTAGTTGE